MSCGVARGAAGLCTTCTLGSAPRRPRGAAGLFLTTGTAGSTVGRNTFSGAPVSLTIGGGAPAALCSAEGIARFWSRWDALIL